MQCFCGAYLCTFIAENTLCSVFSPAGFPVDGDIHRASLHAFFAVYAFALITMDAQKRKIAHRLEKDRDGAKILAKRTVILARKCQRDSRNIV